MRPTMNLLGRLRAWAERRRVAARKREIARLKVALAKIEAESNAGRAQRLLGELPEVTKTTVTSGGWGRSTVEVWLHDGRDFFASDFHTINAIHKAASRIVNYYLERLGEPSAQAKEGRG